MRVCCSLRPKAVRPTFELQPKQRQASTSVQFTLYDHSLVKSPWLDDHTRAPLQAQTPPRDAATRCGALWKTCPHLFSPPSSPFAPPTFSPHLAINHPVHLCQARIQTSPLHQLLRLLHPLQPRTQTSQCLTASGRESPTYPAIYPSSQFCGWTSDDPDSFIAVKPDGVQVSTHTFSRGSLACIN